LTPVDDFVEEKLGKYEYGKKLGGGHAHLIEPTALRRWALWGGGGVAGQCTLIAFCRRQLSFYPKRKSQGAQKNKKKRIGK